MSGFSFKVSCKLTSVSKEKDKQKKKKKKNFHQIQVVPILFPVLSKLNFDLTHPSHWRGVL